LCSVESIEKPQESTGTFRKARGHSTFFWPPAKRSRVGSTPAPAVRQTASGLVTTRQIATRWPTFGDLSPARLTRPNPARTATNCDRKRQTATTACAPWQLPARTSPRGGPVLLADYHTIRAIRACRSSRSRCDWRPDVPPCLLVKEPPLVLRARFGAPYTPHSPGAEASVNVQS
jgi:hypothetical protein